jgi:hypothetical protein
MILLVDLMQAIALVVFSVILSASIMIGLQAVGAWLLRRDKK